VTSVPKKVVASQLPQLEKATGLGHWR
jgi:hypothetical protein